MSHDVPERGRLTDALVAYLREHPQLEAFGLLVGDGDVPPEAGWPTGQGQVGTFVASTTVRTQPAVPLHRETVRARHTSWRCRYGIKTIGGARAQADAGADVVRQALVRFKDVRIEMANGDYGVQDAVFESLGPVGKAGVGDTATWEVEDVIDLWLVRATT